MAGLVALLLAFIASSTLSIGFVELFIIFSGIAAIMRLVYDAGRQDPDPTKVESLVEWIEDETTDPSEERQKIGVVEIITQEPGISAFSVLFNNGDEWTISRLVDSVAEETAGNDSVPETRKELHRDLYRDVLPEMDRQGIVEFDRQGGLVRLTDYGIRYGELLELQTEQQAQVTESTYDKADESHVSPSIRLTAQELFGMISNNRRLWVLFALSAESPRSTSELADFIVNKKYKNTEDIDKHAKKSAYVSLHQTHLPKLKSANLITETGENKYELTDCCTETVQILKELIVDFASHLGQSDVDMPPSVKSIPFKQLSNERRRLCLRFLSDADDNTLEIRTLAELVAENEADQGVGSMLVKRVYVSLYQTHLPLLEESSYIEFKKDRGLVKLTEKGQQLSAFQAEVAGLTDPDT